MVCSLSDAISAIITFPANLANYIVVSHESDLSSEWHLLIRDYKCSLQKCFGIMPIPFLLRMIISLQFSVVTQEVSSRGFIFSGMEESSNYGFVMNS